MTDNSTAHTPLISKLGGLAVAGLLAQPASAAAGTGGHASGVALPEYALLLAVLLVGLLAGAGWGVFRRASADRKTLSRIDRGLVAVADRPDLELAEPQAPAIRTPRLAPSPPPEPRSLAIDGRSGGAALVAPEVEEAPVRPLAPVALADVSAGPPPERPKSLGYASVGADEDPQGPGFRAQAESIERACHEHGLDLLQVVRDIEPDAGSDLKRPGLIYSLERIAAGEASCLVVSGLDRLARSAADLGKLVKWFEQNDGRLIAIDLDLDTDTPGGRTVTRTLAAVGDLDRRRLAESTRKGLAAARAKGTSSGRPAVSDRPGLRARIETMRKEGMTLQAIADALNEEGVPTLRGGAEWRPSSVQAAAGYKRPGPKSTPDGLPSTAGSTSGSGMDPEGA